MRGRQEGRFLCLLERRWQNECGMTAAGGGTGRAGELKLYKVIALRAHNTRKGRAKASDRVIYVLGKNALSVKDAVERGPGRVPGIKAVIGVEPVGVRDLGRLG